MDIFRQLKLTARRNLQYIINLILQCIFWGGSVKQGSMIATGYCVMSDSFSSMDILFLVLCE